MERAGATLCNRKCSILQDFCYAKCLAYYALDNKSSKTCELDDNLIENNHEECPYPQKLN